MLVDSPVDSPPLELVADVTPVPPLLPSLVPSVASVVDPVDPVAVIVDGEVIVIVKAWFVAEASVVSSPPEQAPQTTTTPIANTPPHPR